MQHYSLDHERTATNKTPRKINRNLVFHLIRKQESISRADLARASGLQRSTISLIVEDLIEDGWIVEGSVGQLPRGRRPTFLELNSQRAIVAVDIRPAQTTIAVADLGGSIVEERTLLTPEDANKALGTISRAIHGMLERHPDRHFDGIGICLPGRTDLGHKKLIFAPNLKWPVLSLKDRMERATGLHVEMDNVANACAISEVWFGSSDGLHDLVAVNVSEGIGTGLYVNRRLLRGESGMAGEFGHVQLAPGGPLCACGNHGCWETLASNRAGLRYYHELAGSEAAPLASFESLLKLYRAHDPHAVEAVSKMARFLGAGLRMIAAALAPREIVVVGDITAEWATVGPIVTGEMSSHRLATVPILRPALHGVGARLRSAVALVLSESKVWTGED